MKEKSIILLARGKVIHFVFETKYFSGICLWERMQKTSARILTAVGVVLVKVNSDYKHRVH